MIKQQIKKILRRIGLPAFKKELSSLQTTTLAYQRLAETYVPGCTMAHPSCEGIVFSKDRAMQLHALLLSYYAYVKNPSKLYILYTASNARHAAAYQELQQLLAGKDLVFIPEKAFKSDLEQLLAAIKTTLLFFMTDDGLFIDAFDMHEVVKFNPVHIVPSLIKGMDLTYCYIQNKKQSLPEFIRPGHIDLPADMKCWEWGRAEPGSDWAYPMSLDCTFYNKTEIEILIAGCFYKAPNSLETALHNNYAAIFLQRKGLCYNKAKYVNIVCNVVNTEHNNRNTGLHSADSLLAKWNEGYRIEYERFFGKSCGEAEIAPFTFIKR